MAKLIISNKKLKGYLHTLEICKRELPADTHSAHFERLEYLIWQLKNKLKEDEF